MEKSRSPKQKSGRRKMKSKYYIDLVQANKSIKYSNIVNNPSQTLKVIKAKENYRNGENICMDLIIYYGNIYIAFQCPL